MKSILQKLCTAALALAISQSSTAQPSEPELLQDWQNRLDIYHEVSLNTDLSHLNQSQRKMLGVLIDAAKIMDDLFWRQAFYQPKALFLKSIKDPKVRRFAEINYGPWDRLQGDEVFLTGFDKKAKGAEFYPHGMSKAAFEAAQFNGKKSLYSLVRSKNTELLNLPFHRAYQAQLEQAAELLRQAAKLAQDPEFANYLMLRAEAIRSDDYQASDLAWMDMKNNPIDIVIGAIETYEDQLYGYRAAYEAYVLIKDVNWSRRLAKYASTLPALQKDLPVAAKYKQEVPGGDADLNAYDVIYYAGHANAGGKTIAINLPNDEQVQLQKGTRRLQLKNAMRAKFDYILAPIAEQLIVPAQLKNISFNAFFSNTMFHEVAHGLGIKNTINGRGTVRHALKEHASALEEGKADILGLYMVSQLYKQGILNEGKLEDYYTTFLAGIFRSVRFGASSAHGKANMVRFNYFAQHGAFFRDQQGRYGVNMKKMEQAMTSLSELILRLQGDGDYQGVTQLFQQQGKIGPHLAKDLALLQAAKIPVDITFKQGKKILGLK